MIQSNEQNSPRTESQSRPPQSQVQSQKTPTHLTIQQQNQNNKQQQSKPVQGKTQKLQKRAQDKKFRKLSKQSKKVKSLEDEYRQLQEELKEIKQLVQLQVQMITYSTQEINEKNSQHLPEPLSDLQSTLPPTLTTTRLQSCLQQLFTYHSAIQTANSNYLLLSQVNKEQESQQIFHIHSLEERIRQLRFLLNGKQDLLAYETATFEGAEHLEHDANDVKKIFIDYHLPRRESLGNKNNMESEFRFVEKVITEMVKLKKNIQSLENQLSCGKSHRTTHSKQNEQNHEREEKDSIKENDEEQKTQRDSNVATPVKTSRNRDSTQLKAFKDCQNIVSAQTARYAQKSSFFQAKVPQKQLQRQPTLLPLSIQNYKHSLIYRVGKLQAIEQQSTKKLKEKHQQLIQLLKDQQQTKKKLVKQYELKRDVYEYKKRLQMGNLPQKTTEIIVSKKNHHLFIHENILDALEDPIFHEEEPHINIDASNLTPDSHQASKEHTKHQIEASSSPRQLHSISYKKDPTSKPFSVVNLSELTDSKNTRSIVVSPQKKLVFQQLTNSKNTSNKKLYNSPFLKLKGNDSKLKHSSNHGDLTPKTTVKDQKHIQDQDKENTPRKMQLNLNQKDISKNLNEEYAEVENNQKEQTKIQIAVSPEQKNYKQGNKKARSTLRKRRQNGKNSKKQELQIQQRTIPTDCN